MEIVPFVVPMWNMLYCFALSIGIGMYYIFCLFYICLGF